MIGTGTKLSVLIYLIIFYIVTVINGSTLRHYRNIWGITEKLCKYFGTTKEKIYEVCEKGIKFLDRSFFL